jgi:protein-tyrosine-phosphatase
VPETIDTLFLCTGNSCRSQIDPAKVTGTGEEIMNEFRAVREEIKKRVRGLLEGLTEGDAQ